MLCISLVAIVLIIQDSVSNTFLKIFILMFIIQILLYALIGLVRTLDEYKTDNEEEE